MTQGEGGADVALTARQPLVSIGLQQLFARREPAATRVAASENLPAETDTGVTSLTSFDGLARRLMSVDIPAPVTQAEYLAHLAAEVVPHTMHVEHPRFIGHMTSALPNFTGVIAERIAVLNQNLVKTETSKVLTALERQVLAKLHRVYYGESDAFYRQHIHEPSSTLGMLVSGGTAANLTALWCARNAASRRLHAPSLAHLGDAEVPPPLRGAVIGSELIHYSFYKAIDLLGLGPELFISLPVGANHQVDPADAQRAIANCRAQGIPVIALVGVAGTTDSGAIDPLSELAAVAASAQVHFHVDAAWGGALAFSPSQRGKLQGIEQADSITVDAHKQLYCPMGIGLLLLRNPHLARHIEKTASYVIREGGPDLGRRSLEGSRPASVLHLDANLAILGTQGLQELIDSSVERARLFAEEVTARPEFEVLMPPMSNIVLYRHLPARYAELTDAARRDNLLSQWNKHLQRCQRQCGRTFVSRTVVPVIRHGERRQLAALRTVHANPLTTLDDLRAVLDDQQVVARQFAASFHPDTDDCLNCD